MKPEDIVLFPTTHEQSLPTFHVPEDLLPRFVNFLKEQGLKIAEPPEALSGRNTIEVLLEAETPLDTLEAARKKFLKEIGR